jgi:KDO2-lipid IV(A) lauroyltransferase
VSRPVTLRHRLEYAGFRVLKGILTLLPEAAALAIGEALGWVAGRALGIRRRVVAENLARAFPERSPGWRRRVASRSWRHLGREGAALFRLGALGADRVRRTTTVEGMEPLQAALARGSGAIVVTGHLGSWEVGGAALAVRGIPVDGVALVQANPLFDADLVASRRALGLRIVSRGDAPREVLRSLARNRVPALVADQNARRGGVFVDFFGHAAATYRGPALFSLRTGAPLFLGVCLRTSRHPQRYRVVIEPVAVPEGGDLESRVARLTAAHTAALERWVRNAPEQYFWPHKRWKTRPADTAPETLREKSV